jgi:manganese efflux pump family protein
MTGCEIAPSSSSPSPKKTRHAARLSRNWLTSFRRLDALAKPTPHTDIRYPDYRVACRESAPAGFSAVLPGISSFRVAIHSAGLRTPCAESGRVPALQFSLRSAIQETRVITTQADIVDRNVDYLTLFLTALALGTDAFAVAMVIAAGLPCFTARHTFRLAWHFGLFQSMMTALGWLGGEGLSAFAGELSKWIAFGLLVALGINMIRQSLHPEDRADDFDPTRGWSLVGLSVATSIDALAVGISLGLLGTSIPVPALVIGLVALAMTFVGTRIGLKAGDHLGQWAERVGGFVLIAIGIRVLL